MCVSFRVCVCVCVCVCSEGRGVSKSAAVREFWRRFKMMNDLISSFVLPFEHFYSLSIYVAPKNKLQDNNSRKSLRSASESLRLASSRTWSYCRFSLPAKVRTEELHRCARMLLHCPAGSEAFLIGLISSFCLKHQKPPLNLPHHLKVRLYCIGLGQFASEYHLFSALKTGALDDSSNL